MHQLARIGTQTAVFDRCILPLQCTLEFTPELKPHNVSLTHDAISRLQFVSSRARKAPWYSHSCYMHCLP